MDSIGYNLLSFKKNEIEHFIIIPKMLNYKKEYAQIEVFYKNESYYLKIHSLNEILNNEYKIEFIKDYERKLLGIRLASDRLTLVAYKFHQDYNIDGFAW